MINEGSIEDELFANEMESFTVLENKTIGRNFYRLRKIRDKKAGEVANHVGMGEAAYTKYERGESKITIDLLQKVAEFHNVDPLSILSASSPTIIENGNNSPIQSQFHTLQTTNTEQSLMMLKLMETVLTLSERIATLLENKKL